MVGLLYWQYGSAKLLPEYYSKQQRELRNMQDQLRPIYAQLQRELVKSRLELPFALDNLDLILNFAMIHSKIGAGTLPAEVKILLQAVLRAIPEQITALNLLAIDAYKRDNLQEAVDYWQKIVTIAGDTRSESEAVTILRQKIAEVQSILAS